MYKLLATTAIIVATASSASAWNDAKTLTNNLNDIYTNLDGGGKFNDLQGNGGELNTFFNNVNTGVTHLTLNVDGSNVITAVVNEGTTLEVIQNSASDLINRVNYDVFVETTGDGGYAPNATWDNYTTVARPDIEFTEVENVDPIKYAHNYTGGLLGAKIDNLVADVDTINNVLISTGENAQRDGFIAAWGDGKTGAGTVGTVEIADLQTDIGQLNTVAGIVSNADTGLYNDNIGLDVSTDVLANDFNILGLKSDGSINDGTNTFSSILEWASQP